MPIVSTPLSIMFLFIYSQIYWTLNHHLFWMSLIVYLSTISCVPLFEQSAYICCYECLPLLRCRVSTSIVYIHLIAWILFEAVFGVLNFSVVLQNVIFFCKLNVFCLCKIVYAWHMFSLSVFNVFLVFVSASAFL